MTSKPEITLEHFYIFNGTYAKREGEASMQKSLEIFFQLKCVVMPRKYINFL